MDIEVASAGRIFLADRYGELLSYDAGTRDGDLDPLSLNWNSLRSGCSRTRRSTDAGC